jgi:integrase
LVRGKKPEDRIIGVWRDSNSLGHSFKWLCHRAGIEGLHVHDLRHEGISRVVEKNRLNLIETMSMTGHSDPRTLKRYSNLRPSSIAEKLD